MKIHPNRQKNLGRMYSTDKLMLPRKVKIELELLNWIEDEGYDLTEYVNYLLSQERQHQHKHRQKLARHRALAVKKEE